MTKKNLNKAVTEYGKQFQDILINWYGTDKIKGEPAGGFCNRNCTCCDRCNRSKKQFTPFKLWMSSKIKRETCLTFRSMKTKVYSDARSNPV